MLNSFALSALDIYGHGGDYGRVKTHALILFIEPRVNPKVKNNSTLFEVTEMKVMAWSEVMAKLAEGDVDEDDLKRMDFEMAGKPFDMPSYILSRWYLTVGSNP